MSFKLHPPIDDFFKCFPHASKLLSTLKLCEISVWIKNLSGFVIGEVEVEVEVEEN